MPSTEWTIQAVEMGAKCGENMPPPPTPRLSVSQRASTALSAV